MTFNLSPWNFMLVLGRTSALVAFFPMLQEAQVPRSVRIGIALWISLAISPIVPMPLYQPSSVIDLLMAVGMEVLLGCFFAITLRVIFSAILLGTQWIDSEVGFQVAHQINPLTGSSNTPVGTIAAVVAGMIFWSLGFFEKIIVMWAKIFTVLPAPILVIPPKVGDTFLTLTAHIFVGAFQIATPIVITMFLVSFTIGLVARALQGVNIFVESFTLKIFLGLGALILFTPFIMTLIESQMNLIPEFWAKLLRALK